MNKTLNYIKMIILAGVVALQLQTVSFDKIAVYVVLILTFIFNHQLRKYRKGYVLAFSLAIDLSILVFLTDRYSLANALLILITSIDIILNFGKFRAGALVAVTVVFGYVNIMNWNDKSLIFLLFYAIFISYTLILHKQQKENYQLNFLNDDLRKHSYQLERAKSQIERYTQEVSELSKIRERNRIAEDLHDSIGHKLTSLLYQLQAYKVLLTDNPEARTDRLDQIIESLRGNIILLRNTVKNVEVKSYKSFKSSVTELIEEFHNNVPVVISFKIDGQPYQLSPGQETVLYNNIRESLTNFARHSTGDKASIHLTYNPDNVELLIKDNGSLLQSLVRGYGIRAMEKRTELIGGSMAINTESGMELYFQIPIKGGIQ